MLGFYRIDADELTDPAGHIYYLPSDEYFSQIGTYYSELGNAGYDFSHMRKYLIDFGLNLTLIDDASSFHSPAMDNFDASGLDAL